MSRHAPSPVTRRETVHKYLTVRQTRRTPDLELVRPIGEIDLCTAPVLRDVLADTDRRQVPNVLVDLSEVGFLALVGIQVLQAAAARATEAQRSVVLAAPTPIVRRVLSLTDVTGELETYMTMPSALSALSPAPVPVTVPTQATAPTT